ncbi:hypothetical protein [Rhodococcus sp. SGAir0479]|uniref:hypothetical protein n=1 Tax=Rhodococcus sp. SGAir0479 TaxID=2567884 RepID=UPI0010CD55F8|nr:hypothetical protein [Rhodococcus sp. SGAir0479]QCQ90193.1 hypothetical protein E7742_02495 [Rhodococcus sp. SGAir0479]
MSGQSGNHPRPGGGSGRDGVGFLELFLEANRLAERTAPGPSASPASASPGSGVAERDPDRRPS